MTVELGSSGPVQPEVTIESGPTTLKSFELSRKSGNMPSPQIFFIHLRSAIIITDFYGVVNFYLFIYFVIFLLLYLIFITTVI